jgi:hypothetical protein
MESLEERLWKRLQIYPLRLIRLDVTPIGLKDLSGTLGLFCYPDTQIFIWER